MLEINIEELFAPKLVMTIRIRQAFNGKQKKS